MNSFASRTGELVNVSDLLNTDIFQMLMTRDNVEKQEFLRLCAETKRDLIEHQA